MAELEAMHEYLSGPVLKQFSTAESIDLGDLHRKLHQYLKLAIEADKAAEQQQNLPQGVENAVRLLTRFFNAAVNDRSPSLARKSTVTLIFAVLFPAYVRLGNWRLAGNVIRVLDNAGDAEIRGLKGDRVKYHYWRGRYALSQGDAASADVHFKNAMALCHCRDSNGISLIYSFRSLTRLYLNKRVPNYSKLTFSNAQSLVIKDVVERVRAGDIMGFRKCLERHQALLLKNHLYYFLAAKLSHLVVRQLCRRVWLAVNCESRLHLSLVVRGCQILSKEEQTAEDWVDEEEMECLLANGISEGFIKGYISHERKVLVLSKKNPFPISS